MLQSNLYQIFIRNFTQEGTFKAAKAELDRVKEMGFDVIYLMPIHPISKEGRKGTYGSPYAIADYYGVSDDLGTKEDLKEFLEYAHSIGLSVLMDIVFNHSGNDHVWVKEHPDFYIKDEKGNPTRKVDDWSDILDYDLSNPAIFNELKKVIGYWVEFGFDGFRCDVAPLLPYEFWVDVISTYPQVKWFSESVDHGFLEHLRKAGESVLSDGDILTVFDGSYDYDVWKIQQEVMKDPNKLDFWAILNNFRVANQIENRTKWHLIENHDNPRLRDLGFSDVNYKLWLAHVLFQSGMGFVYQGQESKAQPNASFFEKEMINKDLDESLVNLITALNTVKKEWVSEGLVWEKHQYDNGVYFIEITTNQSEYILYLNFSGQDVSVEIEGDFIVIEKVGTPRSVNRGKIELGNEPIIIKKTR